MMTRITRPVIKRCPYRDETDAGTLTIEYAGEAPELHGLAAKIDALCGDPITHEQFTERVTDLVPGALAVTTFWHTGPWSVEVTG